MNKTEFIEAVAKKGDFSKKDAEKAVNAFIDVIKESLKKKKKVQLVNFGTFEVKTRAARVGRNPQTNEAIKIPKTKYPSFSAGKGFKDAVK
ncbi:MAG: HU family DNA-binding protein [Clostridia bacterium]|nr:HU family DNA-binding protein [Clostridia bacterium]